MAFFETKQINKSFTNHQALKNVSISVPEKSIFGLLGPNGAGKTTLIRIINQITAPDSGEVWFNGEKLNQKHIAQIGYLPEERGLYKKMKVGEQALYLAKLKNLSGYEAKRQLIYWFKKFDLMPWWNRKVEELSKGMQQKVQFIVTILHKPKLLIFDEPFSGFDPVNTQILKSEILKLRDEGATVIFSTHNMVSVEEICDHIALIHNAEKILEGEVEVIRQQFSKKQYEIALLSEQKLPEEIEGIDILKQWTDDNFKCLKVQLNEQTNTNELLTRLMPYGRIRKFSQVIPGMNDIFIQLVSNPS
jgi:ABC-2 type transport system ATP-binding protein